ncbi:MAG: cation transporter [Eubacterium sp.]|nr:cation transporter [Eubacterium sp.]
MKKKFKMQDVDCANCAAKMEDAIKKIDGVNDASVNFMMQKLTIDADDEKFDEIMAKAQVCVSNVDKEAKILMD